MSALSPRGMVPNLALASVLTSSLDPTYSMPESLLDPDRDRIMSSKDYKDEMDLFFELPEDEQRKFLKSLLVFADDVALRYPDFPRPRQLLPVQCLNLYVKVMEAASLTEHASPPGVGLFVRLSVGSKMKKTGLAKDIVNPKWDEGIVFKKVKKYKTLIIEIFETLANGKSLKTGHCQVPLDNIEDRVTFQKWITISLGPENDAVSPQKERERSNSRGTIFNQASSSSGITSPKSPSYGEILLRICYTDEKINDPAFLENPHKFFGMTLSDLNKRDGQPIPIIVEKIITYLEQHKLNEQGLFRLVGSHETVMELKNLIETGKLDVDLRDYPTPVVASLLKLFFDSLPNPVIPFCDYEVIMATADLPVPSERILVLRKLLGQLPTANHLVLRYTCGFLRKVADRSDVNLMTSSNLAIIWGMLILRTNDILLSPRGVSESVTAANKCQLIAQTLIDNSDNIFQQVIPVRLNGRLLSNVPPSMAKVRLHDRPPRTKVSQINFNALGSSGSSVSLPSSSSSSLSSLGSSVPPTSSSSTQARGFISLNSSDQRPGGVSTALKQNSNRSNSLTGPSDSPPPPAPHSDQLSRRTSPTLVALNLQMSEAQDSSSSSSALPPRPPRGSVPPPLLLHSTSPPRNALHFSDNGTSPRRSSNPSEVEKTKPILISSPRSSSNPAILPPITSSPVGASPIQLATLSQLPIRTVSIQKQEAPLTSRPLPRPPAPARRGHKRSKSGPSPEIEQQEG